MNEDTCTIRGARLRKRAGKSSCWLVEFPKAGGCKMKYLIEYILPFNETKIKYYQQPGRGTSMDIITTN